jgi:uncharacterized protein (UPF0248 family)
MMPIHEPLQRIRWDPRFRAGKFEIGYYGRRRRRILVAPFEAIEFPASSPMIFELYDAEGERHRVPFHRVRRLWRDGRLIWKRDPEPAGNPPGECPPGLRTGAGTFFRARAL